MRTDVRKRIDDGNRVWHVKTMLAHCAGGPYGRSPKIRTSRATRTALRGDQASIRSRRRRRDDSRAAPLHIQGCEHGDEVASRFPATAGNEMRGGFTQAERRTGTAWFRPRLKVGSCAPALAAIQDGR